uniref:hypothetical protein n=1 Tax=Deinococcus sp. TaxID=47478 RepID=UPI0025B97F01
GKPCEVFTLYSAAPNGTPTVFRNGVSAMLKYQAQANIRALKQNMQATEFEEYAQQGKQEQYIYNGLVGGKTVSLVCLLN